MDKASKQKSGMRQMYILIALCTLGVTGIMEFDDYMTWQALAAESPDSIQANTKLEAFAEKRGRDGYMGYCVSCHGENVRGAREGVPDLTDGEWLYDTGRVSEIERTILYGIQIGRAHV